MSETLKSAGAACPKCRWLCPAEFAQKGQAPRWECQDCGASGPLTGDCSISKPAAPPAPPKQPAPWARNLTKG